MIYLFEAFNGGSHKQLINLLQANYTTKLFSLPDKKWHWKMRTGGLLLANQVEETISITKEDIVFATSTFSLCELLALRPAFQQAKKILYFHENQLNYPIEKEEERDYQFGWIQILSCLVADVIYFNSIWNMQSFINKIPSFINRNPDKQPKDILSKIQNKMKVLSFPILLPPLSIPQLQDPETPLHILWNHRWEHDKDPTTFFTVLIELHDHGIPFHLSVLGQSYEETPSIFEEMHEKLKNHIIHFGFVDSKEEYYQILQQTDICVSTSIHEFYGISVLEAANCGNYCICPNRLSYPEIFPREQLYNTKAQLKKLLKDLCLRPEKVRNRNKEQEKERYSKYTWSSLKPQWDSILLYVCFLYIKIIICKFHYT